MPLQAIQLSSHEAILQLGFNRARAGRYGLFLFQQFFARDLPAYLQIQTTKHDHRAGTEPTSAVLRQKYSDLSRLIIPG